MSSSKWDSYYAQYASRASRSTSGALTLVLALLAVEDVAVFLTLAANFTSDFDSALDFDFDVLLATFSVFCERGPEGAVAVAVLFLDVKR